MSARRSTTQEPDSRPAAPPGLETRSDLGAWIRTRLQLPAELEGELLAAVDQILFRHEQLWRESKEQALQAVVTGFTQRVGRMRDELALRDARTHRVAEYFEHLVDELTFQLHRDAKTQLLTFQWFMQRVEASLTLEQRGRWCAMGMIDIASFKMHNDTLGHATGDHILQRVAQLLRWQIRDSDLLVYEPQELSEASPLHARFGGDEFCFFLTSLKDASMARTVAERFCRSIAQHDWSLEDPRLHRGAVAVDIGVVCLRRGSVRERRVMASELARALLDRADQHLYAAKREADTRVSFGRVRLHRGKLVDIRDNDRFR